MAGKDAFKARTGITRQATVESDVFGKVTLRSLTFSEAMSVSGRGNDGVIWALGRSIIDDSGARVFDSDDEAVSTLKEIDYIDVEPLIECMNSLSAIAKTKDEQAAVDAEIEGEAAAQSA